VTGAPDAESVEVVDADGRVEQVVTRAAMRAGNLRHRATFVVVRNTRDEVLVHQRAAWKDIWPSRWDVAFGGVCGVGEAWTEAAERELQEEAGLTAELVDLGPVRYESDETRVVGRVFAAHHDGPATFPDGEVVDHAWVPLPNLATWAASHDLCDDSAAVVLPAYLEHAEPGRRPADRPTSGSPT
jgi:8-oxo-dGTP pyrophosphatase MutT (NUDIX family)